MQYYVKIWQVDTDKDNLPMYLPFQGYDRILRFSGEKSLTREMFKQWWHVVYEIPDYESKKKDMPVLNDLFEMFNINRPDDFKGWSLSVSDIIQLNDKLYFCDTFGWKELDYKGE